MTGALAFVQDQPMFGIAATIVVYAVAAAVYRSLGAPPLLHPVLTATAALAIMLLATGMSYDAYFAQAFPLHAGLGVFVLLLAVPLYRQFDLIRVSGRIIAVALCAGSLTALATALALPAVLADAPSLMASLAPKSTTTPVAVGIAERLGGVPSLTALIVVTTGLFGAAFGPAILAAANVRDHRAIGLALGVASHAIGTARAFQISETAGAFASLGMILNALLTIALAPLALVLLGL
jgi:predicted murein hydrolase (TIGR00659 family)